VRIDTLIFGSFCAESHKKNQKLKRNSTQTLCVKISKEEVMEDDKIESIPKTMEKFFGCSGKMVKPSLDSVKKIVKKVRKGKLVTLEQIREKLARDFKVQTACPASTTKALQLLSKEERPVSYWRVVKKNGALLAKFPSGVKGHASLLQKEGLEIDFSKKNPVVVDYEAKLSKLA